VPVPGWHAAVTLAVAISSAANSVVVPWRCFTMQTEIVSTTTCASGPVLPRKIWCVAVVHDRLACAGPLALHRHRVARQVGRQRVMKGHVGAGRRPPEHRAEGARVVSLHAAEVLARRTAAVVFGGNLDPALLAKQVKPATQSLNPRTVARSRDPRSRPAWRPPRRDRFTRHFTVLRCQRSIKTEDCSLCRVANRAQCVRQTPRAAARCR